MSACSFIFILQFATFVSTKPVDSVRIASRNPCDGVNASPVLYHQYDNTNCPPRYSLKPDGTCPYMNHIVNDCAAFCEIRTYFQYGTEQPFANTYCHGPFTCTITSTHTRSVTWSTNVTPKFLDGLKVGISGGYSTNTADATARAFSVKLEEGDCGYFTFIPIVKSTWYVCLFLIACF